MPKACIYTGFRHLLYKMALLWLYLWAEWQNEKVILIKERDKDYGEKSKL